MPPKSRRRKGRKPAPQKKQEANQVDNKTKAESNSDSNSSRSNSSSSNSSSVDQLKLDGSKAFIAGDYPKALDFFTKAIEIDPTNGALYSNRSATYASMTNWNKSLEDANKTVEVKDNWAKGYYRKGHACEKLLRYQDAYNAYQSGLKVDPNDKALLRASKVLANVLDDLKISQAEVATETPDSDKFGKMCKWLRDGGSQFPKLYLQYYSEDYRGVHCLTKISTGDVILYVPQKHIMTSGVAKESEIGKSILSRKIDLRSKHSFLASYLLQEKNKKKSFWDPYLKILPKYYANMPIFFKEDLLAWLVGSFSLQKISDRIDALRKEFDNIRNKLPEFNKYPLEDFIWARLVVITRIFGLVIKGTKTDGLVPYADMLNHMRPRQTSWTFDDNRTGFIITTIKQCGRGDEIFDSYGRKCNNRFFVNYGFALDSNPDNEAVIRVKLPRTDPHYGTKISFLGGHAITAQREFQIPGNYREKKGKEFFSFLRFIHAQDSELMMISSGDGFKLDDIEPISTRNEIACLLTASRVCKKHLTAFEHSLEEDNKILESGKLKMYSNERNAVIMRRGEKQVLTFFINLAKKTIPLLAMAWKDLKRIAAQCYRGEDPIDYYITAVVVPLVKKF